MQASRLAMRRLRWLKMEQTVSTAPRLAILPADMGAGVPEYLAEALTEETGRRLRAAGGRAFDVIEQDSVSVLAARRLSPAQVGAALNADLVLSGALQLLP